MKLTSRRALSPLALLAALVPAACGGTESLTPTPADPCADRIAECLVSQKKCQSWTLNNPEEIQFNAVELVQDEASHHSNWIFVPDNKFDGPDGVWSCEDRNCSQLVGALAGGVLYAQSTQAAKEVQKFPGGAAVRIPPYSRIISDIHLLNVGTAPVTGHAHLNI